MEWSFQDQVHMWDEFKPSYQEPLTQGQAHDYKTMQPRTKIASVTAQECSQR